MSDPTDECYYDTVADSVEGSSNERQKDETLLDGSYESEHQNSSEHPDGTPYVHRIEVEDDQAKKGKLKTARANLKRINSIVKSKIDVLGRVPMFGGKKKGEKQDKEGKNDQKPVAVTKDSNQKIRTENQSSRPSSQEMLIGPCGATGSVSLGSSISEDTADQIQSTLVDFKSGVDLKSDGVADNRSPLAFDGNKIWPEVLSLNKDHVSENEKDHVSENEMFSTLHEPGDCVDSSSESFLVKLSGGVDTSAFDADSSPSPQLKGNLESVPEDGQGLPVSTDPWLTMSRPSALKSTDTLISTTLSVNRGCLEGVGPAVPVNFIGPIPKSARSEEDLTEYERFYFHSIGAEQGKNSEEDLEERRSAEFPASEYKVMDNEPGFKFEEQDCDSEAETLSENDENNFWGSEFDESSSYQDDVLNEGGGYDISEAPDKPLPPKPGLKAFFSRVRPSSHDPALLEEPSSSCFPVMIDSEKHPPPELPPQPSGLTQNQLKRRMVIASIVSSERSYLESLERLIAEYEKTVLEFISQPKSHVRRVFTEMRQIISHHKMFQIELSECVKVWDQEEKIGDIFTASFSKTMLINAYSIYVNSFAAAMEEIRSLQRSRQAFHDFLLKQEKLSFDRLSIFGLMVKPVQRFPQFIMFLQDLIKFTPQNHDDRRPLQLALTELENVAYRLNERKRQSEQKFQAHQTVQQLIRQKVQHVLDTWNLDMDPKRRLIRSDSVEQLYGESENVKCKDRRLILMNDLVLCVKVLQKEQSGYTVERYALRWMVKLRDLELKDSTVTCDMQNVAERESGRLNISQQLDKPEDDPFHLLIDLHEMVHDHSILEQIVGLVTTLKRSYMGYRFSKESINEISRDLELMIQLKEEQLRLVNSCSIILQDNSRSDKPHYVLQTQTAAIRQDWLIDFLMAKLALDKSNSLAWDGTSGSDGNDFDIVPAHFLKHLHVDVPKNYTKIKCAVPIFLHTKKSASGLGIQHLWVCSSTPVHGQVAILSVHSSKPALIESFRACSCDITTSELVPSRGEAVKPVNFMFSEDTVWMATTQNEIIIFPLASQDGVHRQPLASVPVPFMIISMKFVDERLFCGSEIGTAAVYSRESDGCWDVTSPVMLSFGNSCVKFHFVHEESIWLSCGNKLCQLEINSLQTQSISVLHASDTSHIDHVVKSGVGIWVSFLDNSVIKLFHLETMENLQEISVGNFVSRIRTEKQWTITGSVENLSVTCLAISRGLLWIGTSLGVVLTVPLPRLSDGVPLYRGSPKLSLHAHKGPVRFLILLQCSPNFLEASRANAARSKQSPQNLANDLKVQDSQKEHGGLVCPENAKLDVSGQEFVSESRDEDLPILTVSSNLEDKSMSVKEEINTLPSKCDGQEKSVTDTEIQMPRDRNENWTDFDSEVVMRSKNRSSGIDRKSKTLSFYSEIVNNRSSAKNRYISQSYLNLSSAELSEVEILYQALLEDEPSKRDGRNFRFARNSVVFTEKGKRWSSGRSSARSSNVGSDLHTQSLLNLPQSVFDRQAASQGSESMMSENVTKPLVTSAASPSLNLPNSSQLSGLQDVANNAPEPIGRSNASATSPVKSRPTVVSPSRKAGNSAVVVVSGGDGYCDLDMSRKESKTDDASVLMWIHKYY